MTDIAAINQYLSFVMAKMPETQKGKTHVVQRGESLWSIAKQSIEQNTGTKAKNADINNYMLLIAKTNGFDSYEKMNALNPNQTIYMPDEATVSSFNKNKVEKQKSESELKAEAAKKSIYNAFEILANDPTAYVSKSFGNMYHIYNNFKSDIYMTSRHPVMSVKLSEDNKLVNIAFDNCDNDLVNISYDYIINSNGVITNNFGSWKQRSTPVARLSKEEMAQFEQILLKKINP